jgi:hypothetical protein
MVIWQINPAEIADKVAPQSRAGTRLKPSGAGIMELPALHAAATVPANARPVSAIQLPPSVDLCYPVIRASSAHATHHPDPASLSALARQVGV